MAVCCNIAAHSLSWVSPCLCLCKKQWVCFLLLSQTSIEEVWVGWCLLTMHFFFYWKLYGGKMLDFRNIPGCCIFRKWSHMLAHHCFPATMNTFRIKLCSCWASAWQGYHMNLMFHLCLSAHRKRWRLSFIVKLNVCFTINEYVGFEQQKESQLQNE